MKKIICILLALMPLLAFASDDKKKGDNYNPKYLAGAVTLTDGKVVFKETIKVPNLSKDYIYNKLSDWANNRFKPQKGMNSRVVFKDEDKGQIVALGEEYIVFSSSALSLDRTRIYYYLSMFVSDGEFTIEMSRIKYWYDENRNGGEKYTAEEWIVDDMALIKKKTKLAPICGKFRRETIDLKEALRNEALSSVAMQAVTNTYAQTNTPTVQTVNNTTVVQTNAPVATNNVTIVAPTATSNELKPINLKQLPANLNEIASNGRLTITAGEEEIDVKAEAWGGLGKLLNKDVAYTLIDKSRMAISLIMEHSETYKISFYKTGEAKPIIVFECKKSMKQDLTSEELKSLNQQIDTNKKYTMYIGAITSCMMR